MKFPPRDDTATPGTAENPFTSIREALAQKDAKTIFVCAGTYKEAIALKPGQTLTGSLQLKDGSRIQTRSRPIIRPPSEAMQAQAQPCGLDGRRGGVAVLMRERCTLRHIQVEAQNGGAAVGLYPNKYIQRNNQYDDIHIEDCDLSTTGVQSPAVYGALFESLSLLGGLHLVKNRVHTKGNGSVGIDILMHGRKAQGRIYLYGPSIIDECGSLKENGAWLSTLQVHQNSISTEGIQAHAIALRLGTGSILKKLVLRENLLETKGKLADGMLIENYTGATLENVTVVGKKTETAGECAKALRVNVSWNATLRDLELREHEFSTSGPSADAVGIRVFKGGALATMICEDNTIKSTQASGLEIDLEEDGIMGRLAVQKNSIQPEAQHHPIIVKGKNKIQLPIHSKGIYFAPEC